MGLDMVPKRIFLTNGVGKHKERLTSFELALRDAGIAAQNLVRVSSPSVKRKRRDDEPIDSRYAFLMQEGRAVGLISACLIAVWIAVSDHWGVWIPCTGMVLILALFGIYLLRSER